ncbi:Macrolide export ATP-binding/permease protein MacB [Bacteroidales bacterium Barb7]|nr:Macrolide export ATP-binding/permease protein MacB [Bacteroidales bacterium Barb7]
MFEFDNFREIWGTVRKNKLRTFLTGFSVAWGIFMLIILLGAGNGLKNGITHNFENFATNQMSIRPWRTTMPYKGMQSERTITFKSQDLERLPVENPEIDLLSGIIYHSGVLAYDKNYNTYSLQGIHPDMTRINMLKVPSGNGRFINEIDIRERRKVIVISPRMKEVLFPTENPLGKYILADQLPFQVIGIYKTDDNDSNPPAYIPFSTAQSLYKGGYGVDEIKFTVNGIYTKEQNAAFEKRVRAQFARRHRFDPEDARAVRLWNTLEDIQMLNGILNGITLFIWIIGISTLTAGIVGVSNIMLITVRERTKEFGIRKAIGATPWSILKLIIVESVIITAMFGYVGMLGGIGVTEIINSVMENMGAGQEGTGHGDPSIFRNPTVNMGIALSSTLLLVIAGVVAGYFPARKAVKITAIEAMRHE